MNKKATGIFIATFTILSIALFIYMYIALVYGVSSGRVSKLTGEVASDILERQDLSNMQFLATEKATDYAAYKALVDLGENGGLCQDWSKKECIPKEKEIDDTFLNYFRNHFQKYTQNIPANYSVWLARLSTKEFILFLNSEEVHIFRPTDIIVDYITKHKFNREIDYDLNVYNGLYDKLYALRANTDIPTLLLSKCPTKEELFGDSNIKFKCDVLSKENYIKFEVTQDLLFVKPTISFKVGIFGQAKLK